MKAELSSTRFEEPPRQGEDAIIEDTMEGLSPIVADNNYNNDMFLHISHERKTLLKILRRGCRHF